MSSKQGHDLQRSVRQSCVNADFFENESPYTIVEEDEENTTGAYNKSNDTRGSNECHEDDVNLLDKTNVSLNDEDLDSIDHLDSSNIEGKDIEGCKDAIRFTCSSPIGKWFSDLGSEITVYRSNFLNEELECITNIVVAAYENDDFFEKSMKDTLETLLGNTWKIVLIEDYDEIYCAIHQRYRNVVSLSIDKMGVLVCKEI